MDAPSLSALYGSMLLAGFAASLHCIGMCGPILLGFSAALERQGDRLRLGGTLAYHAGRVWTYSILGFVAGLIGLGTRVGAAWVGWQRITALVFGGTVIVAGLLLSGLVPGVRLDRPVEGCAVSRLRRLSWFDALVRGGGAGHRLLLGAVMGLLPCGVVWAMLVVAAALPGPLHSALGMVVFGLGTLPALAVVPLAGRWAPARLRRHGTRAAAFLLLLAGCWMVMRGLTSESHGHQHHATSAPPVSQAAAGSD